MSNIQAFLEKSKDLIGESEADIKAAKGALESMRGVLDAQIYERLSKLIDSFQIAKDTQNQIYQLSRIVLDQNKRFEALQKETAMMNDSFNRLHADFIRRNEGDRQTRQKLNLVLNELDQYLRRHS